MAHPYRTPAPTQAPATARYPRAAIFIASVLVAGLAELVAVHGWRSEPWLSAPLAFAGVLTYLAGVVLSQPG